MQSFNVRFIDDVINVKICLQSTSRAMGLTGRKRGKDRNRKIEYLQNKMKQNLDEIKNIFHSF